jgi:hypothetical protein
MDREMQLIRRVLVDPSFSTAVHQPQHDSDCFVYYSIDLPAIKYRGFPPSWGFAILRAGLKDQGAIVTDFYKLIKKIPEGLLLLISDSPEVHLEDNIFFAGRNVFCVDADNLPSKRSDNLSVVEPLRRAIRRRLDKHQIATFFRLSPYQKGNPATGWRFYGRKRELEQLLDSPQSYVIVGGRRTGKTSLMLEANARLRERGESTQYLSVEECRSASQVVTKLLRELNPKVSAAAVRRSRALDEPMLTTVLKSLTSQGPLTLFLDELGNVLGAMDPEDWTFFGVLRQFSQQGRLRFVISCFQEFYLNRQDEFNGPLINFASTLRLGAFSRPEAEDFLLTPLEFWKPLGADRGAVREAVLAKVGRHPRFLQAFCYDLFERVAGDTNVRNALQTLLGKDLVECFGESMNEVFWQRNSATLNYLFLKRCVEVDRAGQKLMQVEITDEWLRAALRELGYEAATLDRRNLLDGMELRGFTSREGSSNGERQWIVAPIIYYFFKSTEPDFARLLLRLAEDIRPEEEVWKLRPLERRAQYG